MKTEEVITQDFWDTAAPMWLCWKLEFMYAHFTTRLH